MIIGRRVEKQKLIGFSTVILLLLALISLLRWKRDLGYLRRSPRGHQEAPILKADDRSRNAAILYGAAGDAASVGNSALWASAVSLTDPSDSIHQKTPPEMVPIEAPTSQSDPPVKAQFHVVITHNTEEPFYINRWTNALRAIPYVQELGIKVFVYTKGPSPDLAALQAASGAEEVIELPNIGREGSTNLHHLLNVYEDPPQFILFSQATLRLGQQRKGEHPGALEPWLYDRLRYKFGNHTGFMSLDRVQNIGYCGHFTDMGRDDFYPLWPQIYAMLENQVCQPQEGHAVSFNGHFIVSKRRVLARPKQVYLYLKDLIDAPESHWIHDEPEPKWFDREMGTSTPGNPKFGHTLERLWHILFGCGDPTQMVDCDSTNETPEILAGCSCKDRPI